MNKIGIVTLVDYNNYGNRLQNYATHYTLSSMGYDVQTIDYTVQSRNPIMDKIKTVRRVPFNQIINRISKRIVKPLRKDDQRNESMQRMKEFNFRAFSSKYIKEYKFVIKNKADLEYLNNKYDYFIVGSDQVWNPFFFNSTNNTELNFLPFASKHKRIAFSASFGIDDIPTTYKQQFKKWLSGMEYISVRENSGFDIIKELTGRDSVVLIDPTLMLTKDEWLNISKPIVENPTSNYIITYLIGNEADFYRNIVKKHAEKNNLTVINLGDYSDERYSIDPSEFISYINNADAVFTNSFHGTIFSIIFEKPFTVFNRTGDSIAMNTRIDTLLSKFKFQERVKLDLEDTNDIYNIDFSHTYSIIKDERLKAYKFLRTSLGIKDE